MQGNDGHIKAGDQLSEQDIVVNHVYSAKRKRIIGWRLELNDRMVLRIKDGIVQYDSPTVSDGRHYPKTTIQDFIKWAKADVTSEVPPMQWRVAPGGHP